MMDITAVRAADPNYAYGPVQSGSGSANSGQNYAVASAVAIEAVNTTATVVAKGNNLEQGQIPVSGDKNAQIFTRENLDSMTKMLNDFMQSFNTDIHFKLHDKTKELIVQVVDNSNHKVLKEFPPHQLLDTIAAIRERIGVLLDKRA